MDEKIKSSQSENSLSPSEEAHAARLQSIKQAIEAGTYHVDTLDLANSLLSDLLWEQWEKIRFYKP